jgi:hypothetical protein
MIIDQKVIFVATELYNLGYKRPLVFIQGELNKAGIQHYIPTLSKRNLGGSSSISKRKTAKEPVLPPSSSLITHQPTTRTTRKLRT